MGRQLFELIELENNTRLYREVMRLHQIGVIGRWCLVLSLWLTIGSASLWSLRKTFGFMLDYFTWAALRYGLRYHFLAAMGLGLCVGMTLAVLMWQSRNIIRGLPQMEQRKLVDQVLKIRRQGDSHPLWLWVCQGKKAC
ncbi:hypothetical protein [Lyngbya confervoides]|uniref:Uncharacterized protein n=1 Tax=Lyngbya confervoides BDU141951 TaxID=1574623 RepID=A0ABD4SYA0_9CYAN|nr:hypothetical protein [Lyngbya confervoides]MCM1981467.1 hypothetical protein [Lyngbya confervoides BDU141951]